MLVTLCLYACVYISTLCVQVQKLKTLKSHYVLVYCFKRLCPGLGDNLAQRIE